MKALNRAAGHVRTEVSRRMHIRKGARFVFVRDDGRAYAAHINELLADPQGASFERLRSPTLREENVMSEILELWS